ncbi:uncharacterized protein Z520_00001 [Fonsecaea multimorphosa CBS 102226]|uniref:Uncharacterized protein n=1 Tax=Fonsecaea multimorphosa CBS 102226 TaxID=1442371 RepID=A0A0D2HNA9_9EURO|nr:uncharacterized protein Z520_00001 [Fonsecaea multimorphosa CBS 102226]KIY03311.1 hypothetical protein Z520_00001 [Fonsecaea multimorphosa CBS 102226]OAL32962.1 hypothetical protein AYO22_00047 [Fonsecaea multimorphosa]
MDDETHTTCYIFKPTSQATEEIDGRPQKRRKLSKVPSKGPVQEEYSWPRLLSGQESEDAAALRKLQFESVWAKQEEKINSIVEVVDERFVGPVIRFARTQGAGSLRKHKRLKTALLALGPSRNHHHDLHKIWKSTTKGNVQDEPELLVTLQPAHCPNIQTALKNLVRSAMSGRDGVEKYTEFLNEHKSLIPMPFDLELLQRYVQRHHVERVVISIMDAEGFDNAVLSELISTLQSWSDRIPIVLFIGISTTIELFESRLSRLTVSMLDAQIFEPSPDFNLEDGLFKLYSTIQHDQNAEVFLGPSVVNVLAALAEDQGTTPTTFARAIKYAHMCHFFANPLSILSTETRTKSPSWSPALCQAIRNLASFRSYCEALVANGGDKTQREAVRRLLASDDELEKAAVQAMESGKRIMRSSLSAISTLRYIYHCTLKLEAYTTWESEMHLLHSLPDLTRSEIFEAIEDKLKSPPSGTPVAQMLEEGAPELEDLRVYQRSSAQGSETEAEPETDPPASAAEKVLAILRGYIETRTSSSSSHCVDHLNLNPFRHFLAEAYTMTQKSPLSQTIHPQPRHCIERALTRPGDYLGCSCCAVSHSNAGTVGGRHDVPGPDNKARLPPTSLLLSMLNEAGAVVNVRDLWDAFRDTLASRSRDSRPDGEEDTEAEADELDEDNNDDDDNDENKDETKDDQVVSSDERQTLALFYRALADLRHLGLIKPSKRKPGVECVAKTAWMGL